MPRQNTTFGPASTTSSEVSDSELYSDEEWDGSESELETDPEDIETEADSEEENVIPNVDNQDEEVSLYSLFEVTYNSADDIRNTLVSYHDAIQREFRYIPNDGRRIYVTCKAQHCPFKVNFNFHKRFAPPTTMIPHTCPAWMAQPTTRAQKAHHLCKRAEVKQWMQREGRNATSKGLNNLLLSLGINVKYHVVFKTLRYLKEDMFTGDAEQYSLLDSYAVILNEKGHFTTLERDVDHKFSRMSIIYLQGIQEFTQYASRGIQLDGTFIKNAVGGTLLAACFKDGNNNICVIAVAVVSGENEGNWTWFLRLLRGRLTIMPSFVISDCEKGLINAVEEVFGTDLHHAYCFHHIMKNFNKKFKKKDLKGFAWDIAKATTDSDFEEKLKILNNAQPDAQDLSFT
jgi:hypothetical protein